MNSSKPKIFVQIAAYRDLELAATCNSLLSNAAEPEAIRIGICWQGYPEDAIGINLLAQIPQISLT